jgi:hypothetical protein
MAVPVCSASSAVQARTDKAKRFRCSVLRGNLNTLVDIAWLRQVQHGPVTGSLFKDAKQALPTCFPRQRFEGKHVVAKRHDRLERKVLAEFLLNDQNLNFAVDGGKCIAFYPVAMATPLA